MCFALVHCLIKLKWKKVGKGPTFFGVAPPSGRKCHHGTAARGAAIGVSGSRKLAGFPSKPDSATLMDWCQPVMCQHKHKYKVSRVLLPSRVRVRRPPRACACVCIIYNFFLCVVCVSFLCKVFKYILHYNINCVTLASYIS